MCVKAGCRSDRRPRDAAMQFHESREDNQGWKNILRELSIRVIPGMSMPPLSCDHCSGDSHRCNGEKAPSGCPSFT